MAYINFWKSTYELSISNQYELKVFGDKSESKLTWNSNGNEFLYCNVLIQQFISVRSFEINQTLFVESGLNE